MNFKYIGYAAVILFVLAVTGGFYVVFTRPTSNTVVGKGGKAITINTDKPSTPLMGCSAYKINVKAYWENGFKLQPKEVKE